ncbi:MAG: hypothetical protein GXP18_04730, partial [Gammaproteobacteria bacterium]|nr:hypothetical protein [Gammaproteobacteria bacterium]
LHEIQGVTSRAIGDINKSDDDYLDDAWHRLRAGVNFIRDCINEIGNLNPLPKARTLRIRHREGNRLRDEDLYDRLAEVMFNIIHSAAYIEGPPDKAWSIHHNSVWGDFFGLSNDGRAWKIVQFKLRRLLYDEIGDLESRLNYKSARVLGICLNVMGLEMGRRSGNGKDYAALKSAVLTLTEKHYLRQREMNIEVADACLIGSITFDAKKSRLVKTYAKGLQPEPAREYLPLQSPIVVV